MSAYNRGDYVTARAKAQEVIELFNEYDDRGEAFLNEFDDREHGTDVSHFSPDERKQAREVLDNAQVALVTAPSAASSAQSSLKSDLQKFGIEFEGDKPNLSNMPPDVEWVMDKVREEEDGLIFTNKEGELLTRIPDAPLKYPFEPIYEIAGKKDSHHLYLNIIKAGAGEHFAWHPVVVKMFHNGVRGDSQENIVKELIRAQVFDRLGIGAHFYGAVRDKNGEIIGYAMQIISGTDDYRKSSTEEQTDDFRDVMRRVARVGLDPERLHWMKTRKERLVAIDPIEPELVKQDRYNAFVYDPRRVPAPVGQIEQAAEPAAAVETAAPPEKPATEAELILRRLEEGVRRDPRLKISVDSSNVYLGFKFDFAIAISERISPVTIIKDKNIIPKYFAVIDDLNPANYVVFRIEKVDENSMRVAAVGYENDFVTTAAGKYVLLNAFTSGRAFCGRLRNDKVHLLKTDHEHKTENGQTMYYSNISFTNTTEDHKRITINLTPLTDIGSERFWLVPQAITESSAEARDIFISLVDLKNERLRYLPKNVAEIEKSAGKYITYPANAVSSQEWLTIGQGNSYQYFKNVGTIEESGRSLVVYRRIDEEDRIAAVRINPDKKTFTIEGLEIDGAPVIFDAGHIHLSALLYMLTNEEEGLGVMPPDVKARIFISPSLRQLACSSRQIVIQARASIPTLWQKKMINDKSRWMAGKPHAINWVNRWGEEQMEKLAMKKLGAERQALIRAMQIHVPGETDGLQASSATVRIAPAAPAAIKPETRKGPDSMFGNEAGGIGEDVRKAGIKRILLEHPYLAANAQALLSYIRGNNPALLDMPDVDWLKYLRDYLSRKQLSPPSAAVGPAAPPEKPAAEAAGISPSDTFPIAPKINFANDGKVIRIFDIDI
ncbi:MAG: hypothetical protein Q7S07_00985, partial [Candidatus Omnitrophota bacterium]|nr:hypothetical protein [Candidatus Omnitrophota bacterium]